MRIGGRGCLKLLDSSRGLGFFRVLNGKTEGVGALMRSSSGSLNLTTNGELFPLWKPLMFELRIELTLCRLSLSLMIGNGDWRFLDDDY